MAITVRQHGLRRALAACRTADEARTIIAGYGPRARADWAHIAKSLRVFDAALVDLLFMHYEAIAYLGRNRSLPPALRERLYLRLAADLRHPAVWGTLTAAASRRRIRYGDAVCAALLAQAQRGGAGHTRSTRFAAVEVLSGVHDLPRPVRITLFLELAEDGLDHIALAILAGRRFGGPADIDPAVFCEAFHAAAVRHRPAALLLLQEATGAQRATLTAEDLEWVHERAGRPAGAPAADPAAEPAAGA